MYESPIEVICNGVNEHQEDNIYKMVLSYDVKIDKDELLKALAYDRSQYEKGHFDGYADGYKDREEKIVKCRECKHFCREDSLCIGLCEKHDDYVNEAEYCNRGERKNE